MNCFRETVDWPVGGSEGKPLFVAIVCMDLGELLNFLVL